MFNHLILDLDETLYPRSTGLMAEINRRIPLYMITRMSLAPTCAALARQPLPRVSFLESNRF